MKRLILQILLFPVLPCFCKGGSNEIPETAQDHALAAKAMEEFRIYQETYQPVMKQFIGEMYFGPETEERVAGATNADVMKKQAAVKPNLDPSSGRVIAGLTSASENAGAVAAESMVRARQGVKDIRVKGMEGLAEIGRQGSTDVNASMANLAKDATTAAIESKRSDIAVDNATTAAVGSAAGLGIYALKKDDKKETK